jgi:WD40 repeat protein
MSSANDGSSSHTTSGISILGSSQRQISQQQQQSYASNHSFLGSDFMSRLTSGSPSKSGLGTASPIRLAESGRRPSGNMSRMASFYGSASSGPSWSGSPEMNKLTQLPTQQLSTIMSESNTNSKLLNKHPKLIQRVPERVYFQASNEILACDRSWETPNLVAIATPRNLQLLKISESDASLQTELTMKPAGRVKISTISDLAFGHQQYGRYLAASTITGAINIYHFDRGTRAKTTLQGHNRAVNSIAFNYVEPHILASGSQDGNIMIWDLKASNSKPSMILSCNADAVRCCSFNNKKGHALAAVFDSGVLEKWDLRKNTTWERRINAHTGPALTVHWHPELDYVVTGGRDRQLQVWNMEQDTREPAHAISTSGPIAKARWCKGRGNSSIMNTDIAVAFFNDDPTVQVWNLNRKYIPKHVINAHSAPVTQLIWRTPKHLISTSKDKTLVQYDITKEAEFIENLPSAAMTWNPNQSADLVVIKQDSAQFQGPFPNSTASSLIRQTQTQSQPPMQQQSHIFDQTTLKEYDEPDTESINASATSMSVDNPSASSNLHLHSSSKSHFMTMPPEVSGMQLFESAAGGIVGGNNSGGSSSPTLPSSLTRQRQPIISRQPSYVTPRPVLTTTNSNGSNESKSKGGGGAVGSGAGTGTCMNTNGAAASSKLGPPPAWVTPVHVPLPVSDVAKAQFLSTNYVVRVPPQGGDIVEVCEYNSMLAASVGHFRDCQTWRAIKMAIVLDKEVKAELEIGGKLEKFHFESGKTYAHTYGNGRAVVLDGNDHDDDMKLGTSYGSESDVMKKSIGSAGSGSYGSAEYGDAMRAEARVQDESAIAEDDDDDEVVLEENKTDADSVSVNADDTGNPTMNLPNNSHTTPLPIPVDIQNKLMQDEEHQQQEQGDEEEHGGALARSNPRSYRYSFTGSSIDLDDEKCGSPHSLPRSLSLMSLSVSPSMKKSRSRLMMSVRSEASELDGLPIKNPTAIIGVSRSADTRVSKTSDTRSHLTAILKEGSRTKTGMAVEQDKKDKKEDVVSTLMEVPWNPRDMIREAAEYSCGQGDIVMCATLALLFDEIYPGCISKRRTEEWVYDYHQYLLRCGFFGNAATILRIASERFEEFKSIGQTKTSVRMLCCHCQKPLLNEESKTRYNEKDHEQEHQHHSSSLTRPSFGFWYCDRCRQLQGGCSYCGEPVKGNLVALRCGHGGHFGCLRTWFLDQLETECPACGASCVSVV